MAEQLKIFTELVTAPSNKMKWPASCGQAMSTNMYFEDNTGTMYLKSIEGLKTKVSFDKLGKYDLLFVTSVGEQQYNFKPSLIVVRNGNLYRYNHTLNETLLLENVGSNVKVAESGGENPCLFIVNGKKSMYMLRLKENNAKPVEIPLINKIDSDETIDPVDVTVVNGSVVVVDRSTSFVYYSVPYPIANDERVVYRINKSGNKWEVDYESDGITPKYVKLKSDGRYEYNYKTGETGQFIDNTDNVYSYLFLDDFHNKQYFSAESSSDIVKGVYTLGKTLVLFGTNSIEFYDRGDAESYKTWTRQSFTDYKEHGLYNRNTVASTNGFIFYVGQSDMSTLSINAIIDTQIQKISPVWVDEILRSQKDIQYGFAYNKDGHAFYCLELDDRTLVYDLQTKTWHFRVSRRVGTSKLFRWAGRFVVRFNDELLTGSNYYQNLYSLDENYYYEDTNTIKLPMYRQRIAPMMVSQYKPFNFMSLAIEGTMGTAQEYITQDISKLPDYDVAQYNPKVILEISNDGGVTWGNIMENHVGVKGDYSYRCIWHNLGMYRLCTMKITYTEPTPWIINSASMTVRGTVCQL